MSHPRTTHRLRLLGVAAALGASFALTGCGFDAQTLQPYTPAQGVNAEVGTVKVRNLLIIANSAGKGRLSGAFISNGKADTVTGITGTASKPDGTAAGELTIGNGTVQLPANKLVVLTGDGSQNVTVAGEGLKPGLDTRLTLQFASGGTQQIVVPVRDAAEPMYASAAPELKD